MEQNRCRSRELAVSSAALGQTVSTLCVAPPEIRHVLLLLHGYQSSWQAIREHLPLAALAEAKQTLIAVPNLGDDYYISRPGYDMDGFLARELPALLRREFSVGEGVPCSVAGISMGGFGAVLTALHRPEAFCHVLSMGGAFIQNDVRIGNPEIVGSGQRTLQYFQRVFGPFEDLDTALDRNPDCAAGELARQHPARTPDFRLLCGDRDLLWPRNRRMAEVLRNQGFACRFDTLEGQGHDHAGFREAFRRLIEAREP